MIDESLNESETVESLIEYEDGQIMTEMFFGENLLIELPHDHDL